MKSIDFLTYKHQLLYYILILFGFKPFTIYQKNKKMDYRNIFLTIFYVAVGLFLIGFLNFIPYDFSNTFYILLVSCGFIFILLPILNIYLNQVYINSVHMENTSPLTP
jgi:hypothetical protein